jgi:hypothetical protein
VHAACHLLAANVDIADYDAWVERNEREHDIQLHRQRPGEIGNSQGECRSGHMLLI